MISTFLAPLLAAPLLTACGEAQPVDPTFGFEPGAAPSAQGQDPEIPKCEGDEVVLPSGVKYCVLAKGEGGEHPAMGDTVRVDYTGWTLDGRSFDSSRRARRPGMAPEPAEFQVGGVIDGWNEMLQLMVPGDRVLVTIPSELAYGEKGSPPNIGPNATLIFDVELHAIVAKAPRFEAWPAEPGDDVEDFESGVELRVLRAGEGPSVTDGATAVVEMSCWTESGKFAFVHSFISNAQMIPQWRQITKTSQPLPFMRDLLPHARVGARIQLRVPANLGIKSRFNVPTIPDGANELWIVEFPVVDEFPKPEFRMPTADELTTTESGLKYLIVKQGSGRAPKASNTVLAHYNGWLTDGKQFDSSFDRGAAIAFPLNRVVPGWTEGLQLLQEGGAAFLVVPPELGYGARGAGADIPPNSTLLFYVELLAVQ